MKKIAIYIIPEGNFYKIGSEMIGYDIKNEKKLQKNPLNAYGFHLTLTDVISIEDSQLHDLIKRIQKILNLPLWKINLVPKSIGKMPNADVIAIIFHQNFRLFLLHALLVIFIQSSGKNSEFSQNMNLSFWRKLKTKVFNSPYIFDDFIPHMTLGIGKNTDGKINNKFKQHLFKTIQIRKIYLVEEDNKNSFFKIVKFFDI
jgi:2'-5' RNA ligase